jgi:glycosyltransferase involved in cell wall biosynthesis
MKILQVVEACNAGVGRHIRDLCTGLISQGHRVIVAYSPHRTDEAFRQFVLNRQSEIRFVPLNVRREVSIASDLRGIIQVRRLINREGPIDVVHGHSSKGGAIARIASRWSNLPAVYTPHSMLVISPKIPKKQAIFYTWVERILGYWATSQIIAVSEEERDFILELNVAPEERVTVIRNGISNADFDYLPENIVEEDVHLKPLTFGAALRFTTQKAPGCLIEAFAQLDQDVPELPMCLLIAGDGELFAETKRQVEVSGLGDKVRLLGWKTDIKELLREVDIFVVSSLYESGLSYSTMEAMAAGLPIVSTKVFGTKRTIGEVPGNVLVSVGDASALAAGIKRMIQMTSHRSLRRTLQEIGRANRDYARTQLTLSDVTSHSLDVYRTVGNSSTNQND